ncbi:MAG: amino acid permease [Candidatus Sericytochromatia bacterium]
MQENNFINSQLGNNNNLELKERKISISTGTFLVISTMIGTGIFTTTGFMIKPIDSPLMIMFSWLLGGLFALCGALSYAELVTIFPKNGGEYNIITQVYNKALGFCCAWISLMVGFAAAIASSAMAFGSYLSTVFDINKTVAGLFLIIITSFIHTLKAEDGAKFQDLFTIGKIILIMTFIIAGIFSGSFNSYPISGNELNYAFSPAFAVALIYVSYAYSGWEAVGYIAGEMKEPNKSIPISLFLGTAIVTLLYMGLNFVYLYMLPYKTLDGVEEIAAVAGKTLFGEIGSNFISLLIAFGLISAVGAMVISGSRMYEAVGQDFKKLSFFTKKNKNGIPINAIYFQMVISIIMFFSSAFDTLLKYIGFTISIFAGLGIFGVILMRIKAPQLERTYKTFGYPLTPIIFVVLSLWMIFYSIFEEPKVALTGFGTILIGFILYYFLKTDE